LAWAVFHILKTPGVLNKIQEELATVLDGDDVSAQHLPKLKYLEGVVKETLRLSPVIPTVGRVLQRPMTIGGHDLPAGVVVVPCIYLTHRREDIYPDPLMFKPERFQDDGPGPYEFFPFGGGIRRCIGAAFAMYEMKILLAQVVLRTNLELPANYQGRVTRRSITFTPEKGMLVKVKSRK
jgi:cytochrome P450